MNTPSWKDIRKHMRDMKPAGGPAPSDEFWSEFNAKAGLVPQDRTVTVRNPAAFRPVTLAAACAAVLLVMLGLNMMVPAAVEAGMTEVNSVEVDAAHSAVMIMNDEPGECTILWIAGMDGNMQNGEQT